MPSSYIFELLVRAVIMIFAYLAAALASGLVGLIPTFRLDAALFGTFLSAAYGFPVWLMTVIIAHRKFLDNLGFFAVAGLISGIIGAFLFSLGLPMAFSFRGLALLAILLPYAIPGGLIAGMTYWFIAVRLPQNWI